LWSALLKRNKIIGSEKAHNITNNENHKFLILVVIEAVMRYINRRGAAVLLLVDMVPKHGHDNIVFADLALLTYDAGKKLAAV
jgi:hypothetical protein